MARHIVNHHLDIVQLHMKGYATGLYGSPTSGTCDAGNREDCKLGKVVSTMDGYATDMVRRFESAYINVSTDVLLFSECGAPLIHHYRVFGRGYRMSPCAGVI